MKKYILVAGAGGFISGYLVKHFLNKNHFVKAVDIKPLDQWFQLFDSCENLSLNLEKKDNCFEVVKGCDEIYNLACNMGGIGFIENNRALCMLSVLINTHLLMAAQKYKIKKYVYASSACVYNEQKQKDAKVFPLKETDAYPAMPENGYGWEKLFGERMCIHFFEDFGLNIRIIRFHNVYGPHGSYEGGREKVPAAICRKVIEAKYSKNLEIEIWGDGKQTRSFQYIDDCIYGIEKISETNFHKPINLGTSESVTIDQLVDIVENLAKVKLQRKYNLLAPKGVRGRNSDNTLLKKIIGWEPSIPLKIGMEKTYNWIHNQMREKVLI